MRKSKKAWTNLLFRFLPFLSDGILLLVYFFVPNHKGNQITMVYPIFIVVLTVLLLLLFGTAFFSERICKYYLSHVPWYTAFFLILTVWDWLTLKTGIFGLPMFPWPDRILGEMLLDREILLDCAGNSLKLLFTGYVVGLALAGATGIAAGRSEKARYWIAPILRVVGPIPAVTWMALFFVTAPSLFIGCVTMVAYSVWYPVATGIMNGIMQIDREYVEAARMLGVQKERAMIFHVTIPMVMPNLFQGLVGGMRAACGSLVIAEMMGVESGLAWYMSWQRGWGNFTKMYTAIICICLTFLAVDILLGFIKKRVLRWQEANR